MIVVTARNEGRGIRIVGHATDNPSHGATRAAGEPTYWVIVRCEVLTRDGLLDVEPTARRYRHPIPGIVDRAQTPKASRISPGPDALGPSVLLLCSKKCL